MGEFNHLKQAYYSVFFSKSFKSSISTKLLSQSHEKKKKKKKKKKIYIYIYIYIKLGKQDFKESLQTQDVIIIVIFILFFFFISSVRTGVTDS